MTKLQTLIVDDEKAARRKLTGMLKEYPNIVVIDEAKDGQEAIEKIQQHHPQLVFLDIQMPGKTGLEVALETHQLEYQLIFVTAYDEFALKAFETQALDYLLKPVSHKRLAQCINKLDRFTTNASAQDLQTLIAQLTPPDNKKKFGIRHGSATILVDLNHIAYIESKDGYSHIHLNQQGKATHHLSTLLSDVYLESLIKQLSNDLFLRIHRSFIVRINQVQSYHIDGRSLYLTLLEFPHLKLPVSRNNAALVKQLWNVI